MKKTFYYILIAMVSLNALPMQSIAASKEIKSNPTIVNDPGKVISNSLNIRIHEINNMDKSNLNASEKKELRKEVQSMKKMIKHSGGGGIYISVGAIIIILLLLIILL